MATEKLDHTPPALPAMGERRFGRVNWIGLRTLCEREVRRFLTVYWQTLAAPIATAGLFMVVFTLALAERRGDIAGVSFALFLAPGVVMMTIIQNAFANTSSSVTIAKVQGNIVDSLMPPLSPAELTAGFALGGVARGLVISVLAAVLLFPAVGAGLYAPLWALFFTLIGGLILSLLGILTAIWAQKFDHMAAITNFIVTPLSFLSGTFYEISRLPEPWATLSTFNPFFYLIDGFRYGVIGLSDASPWTGAAVSISVAAALWALCWRAFKTGYRLKS